MSFTYDYPHFALTGDVVIFSKSDDFWDADCSIGESITISSKRILIWAIDFFAINTIWFIIFEEPSLTKMFGNEYRGYKRHIHRWLPQLRPYKPESES